MKLIALRCPTCTEPLVVEHDDIIVACNNCRTIAAVSQNGTRKMNLSFVVAHRQQQAAKKWLPFWVFNGRVVIKRRELQGSRSDGIDTERLWRVPRALYVPAWKLSPLIAQSVGSQLIQQQPKLEPIERPEGAQFTSATVKPNEAHKMLEFIVLAIEARRKDWLKYLEFDLELNKPQLMALPQSMFGS